MSARASMPQRLHLLGSAVAVAGVLLTAACGGSSSTGAAQSPTATASGGNASRAAFNECLRKNGVTPPSQGSGGGAFRSMGPEMQQAFQACRSLLPRGNGSFGQNPAALTAFRTCMASHGVQLPTRPSGAPGTPGQGAGSSQNPGDQTPGGRIGGGLRGLNTADPKVAAALKICSALLPTRTPAPAAS